MFFHKKNLILFAFLASGLISACSQNASESTSAPSETSQSVAKIADKPVITANRGEVLYKRCVTCHTLNEGGANRLGPNLYGVFGAQAGRIEGFAYSKAMKESGLIWTDENIDGYIENPAKFMPGNRMSFVGLRKAEDRQAVIDYMKSKTGVSE